MLVVATTSLAAQSSTATLIATVVDETGATLAGADVHVVNTATSTSRSAKSAGSGVVVITSLQPGTYVLQANLTGFRPSELRNIVLNVDDRVDVRIQLALAALGEGVTVFADAQRVRTAPSVGTVVDRQFVENLPLNGRSLQALLELTPGVVLTPSGGTEQGGQFSVNGQRTNSNYFTVDGVSANAGVNSSTGTPPAHSASGQLPALTTLGGTNGLVSVDALQEFRIQTSSYAPEFGRTPGGQVSLVTRSGTNALHGSASEYFRDDALDATDWFVNNKGLKKAALRQHNYGAVLGGPILRNHLFFFGSYEGLRLDRPRATTVGVPSIEYRSTAPAAAQPFLNALPIPNGAPRGTTHADFTASYSDRSELDATALRLDHNIRPGLSVFGRFNYAPSYTRTRTASLNYQNVTTQRNKFATLGITWAGAKRLVNDLRINYTTNDAPTTFKPDDFGGAQPMSVTEAFVVPGLTPENSSSAWVIEEDGIVNWGIGAVAIKQRQLNLVNTTTLIAGAHEFKAGVDFRRIHPIMGGRSVGVTQTRFTAASLSRGVVSNFIHTRYGEGRQVVAFDNLSLFIQDAWKLGSRLTFTYGLRWELVPPPHATEGRNAATLDNLDNPLSGQVRVAPMGTPLWRTRYDNLAPRVGASYVLSEKPGSQLVMRTGFGRFYDLGYAAAANGFSTTSWPFSASKSQSSLPFPLTDAALEPPVSGVTQPSLLYLNDRNIESPYTYQWNVSVERSLGSRQTVTVGYIGADGSKLLKRDSYLLTFPQWTNRVNVLLHRNRAFSHYQAMQLQFQRRLDRGLQALVSYTAGKSQDSVSGDFAAGVVSDVLEPINDYGASDFDVRHVVSAAITYQVSQRSGPSIWRALASDWGLDLVLRARSGFPLNITTSVPFPEVGAQPVRASVVPGQPFWVDDSTAPGKRRLNRAAFVIPQAGSQGDLRRGAVRGFSAQQVDIGLRRDFRVAEGLRAQFRFELFNLLNTPLFADPSGSLSSSTFGLSAQMLNQSLGGLNPLYQIGGPRSSQIAIKLLF